MALGLRNIGKSVLDLPKTVEELRILSKEYIKNLGADIFLEDENIYEQFIRDTFNASVEHRTSTNASM